MDWQVLQEVHAARADALSLKIDQRLYTFGMLETKIRALGALLVNVVIAVWKRVRKSCTEVIVASLDVQTSFAPISTVTYSGLKRMAADISLFRSATFAPDRAKLNARFEMAELTLRMRRYMLLTDVLVPVDQEFAGTSERTVGPELKARVIESPVAMIEFGYGPAAEALCGALTSATAARKTNDTRLRIQVRRG